jgi:hypothetical protein
MNTPKVPSPVGTGWADFGTKSFSVPNTNNQAQNVFDFGGNANPPQNEANNDNWFDFVDAANPQKDQPKSVSNIVNFNFNNF